MVAFRVDGNQKIGMGHLMRCISIAVEVKKTGKELCFLVTEDSDVERLREEGLPFVKIKPSEHSICASEDVLEWLSDNKVDVIFLDSYRVTPEDFTKLRQYAYLFYMDDLYAFNYDADAIVNYNLEATEERYGKKCTARLYLGPQYFPVRSEILEAPKHRSVEKIHNVLISNGSTDSQKITDGILSAMSPEKYPNIRFNCLLGKFFADEYCNSLKEKYAGCKNVHWILWGQDMGKIYSQMDLMIAPAATMIYEAFTVGVPCISYVFCDNQIEQGSYMEDNKMAPYAGDIRYSADKVQQNIFEIFIKMESKAIRDQYYECFSQLFNGKGASRIAKLLLKEDVE